MERRKVLKAKKWLLWRAPMIFHCEFLVPLIFLNMLWGVVYGGHSFLVSALVVVFLLTLLVIWFRLLFTSKLVYQLHSPKERERLKAFSQIVDMGEKAIPLLVQALEAPLFVDKGWYGHEAHRLAVEGLGLLKAKQAIDVLCEALEHPSPSVRAKAVWALGEIGDPSVVPHLIPLLGDCEEVSDYDMVSDQAATVLEEFGEGDLVHAFKKALIGKVDEQVRKILSGKYRPQVVKAFVKALNSELPSVAIGAAWALGELRFVEALPILERKARSLMAPKQVRLACREAAEKLRTFAYLPAIPSVSPEVANLPRPATATEIPKETLPRAVPSLEVNERAIGGGSAKSDGETQ
ncbi:HEAT repeat-containing protein [Candidatus Fervidibacteria bacterium JGI MDM2 SSWTFF-3-K9]